MKQLDEKSLERLVSKMMQEVKVEKTSPDFTSHLMVHLNAHKPSKAFAYQPLISKTGWLFILIGMVLLVSFVWVYDNSASVNWVGVQGMNNFSANLLHVFSMMKFSIISSYAILLTTLMVFIQIGLLLHRQQKRWVTVL